MAGDGGGDLAGAAPSGAQRSDLQAGQFAKRASFTRSVKESGPAAPRARERAAVVIPAGTAGLAVFANEMNAPISAARDAHGVRPEAVYTWKVPVEECVPFAISRRLAMHAMPVGIDIAKSVFQVHYVDADTGEIVNKALKRAVLLEHFSNGRPCLIGIESCGGAQHWTRALTRLGHTVKLMPARFVKACNKAGYGAASPPVSQNTRKSSQSGGVHIVRDGRVRGETL